MNKKKIIIIIVAAVVAVALLAVLAIVGFKSFLKFGGSAIKKFNEPTVYSRNVSGRVGDIVTVPVYISSNPGFMAFLFDIDYDERVLEYVSYSAGDIVNGIELNNTNGVVKIMDIENNDITEDGLLVELKFKIINDSVSSTEIEIDIEDESFCNYNEKFIEVDSEDSEIIIKK